MARRETRSATAKKAAKKVVKKAGTAIARTAKKLTSKLHAGKRRKAEEPVAKAAVRAKPKIKADRVSRGEGRPAKRQTDVPLDVVAATYTPQQTSLKTPFRADGSDRHRDQEFVADRADTRFGDEDHYTNKSGDARIGTHGRTYEPGEKR